MSRPALFHVVILAASVAACGDDGGTGASGGGGSGDGGQAAGGDGQGGQAVGGDGQGGQAVGGDGQGGQGEGGQGEGGADCGALATEVYALLEEAKACNPLIDVEQCTEILAGPCCPVVVNPANAVAVADYQAALDELLASCDVLCPAIPCLEDPGGACTGDTSDGTCTEVAP